MSPNELYHSRRIWARVAGLMYWVVLVLDLAGLQMHSAGRRNTFILAGSFFTLFLALGLFYALKPVQTRLAAAALSFRFVEAGLGIISTLAGFAAVRSLISETSLGAAFLRLAAWNDSTNFAAFAFTMGSTIFFYLFVKSGSIPRVLGWWGLFSSVLAMTACLVHLLRPAFPAMTMYAWIPMLLAETSTGLWLLTKSVNIKAQALGRSQAQAARPFQPAL